MLFCHSENLNDFSSEKFSKVDFISEVNLFIIKGHFSEAGYFEIYIYHMTGNVCKYIFKTYNIHILQTMVYGGKYS